MFQCDAQDTSASMIAYYADRDERGIIQQGYNSTVCMQEVHAGGVKSK